LTNHFCIEAILGPERAIVNSAKEIIYIVGPDYIDV